MGPLTARRTVVSSFFLAASLPYLDKGEFALDKLCGTGELRYVTSGHRYVGQWRDNRKHGEGTFWYMDGNVYTGAFANDVKHGFGKLVYRPGTLVEESYEGEFDRGQRHGRGTYRYQPSTGMVYEGSWHRGLRHGKGTLRWPTGQFYRGDFCQERQAGRGLGTCSPCGARRLHLPHVLWAWCKGVSWRAGVTP